VHIAFQK